LGKDFEKPTVEQHLAAIRKRPLRMKGGSPRAKTNGIFIKRGIVHSFRNDAQEPTTCLVILTPGVLGPGYFREMAALIASGPPDPELMKATMLRYGLIPAAGF
jgi:hypothetical protein